MFLLYSTDVAMPSRIADTHACLIFQHGDRRLEF